MRLSAPALLLLLGLLSAGAAPRVRQKPGGGSGRPFAPGTSKGSTSAPRAPSRADRYFALCDEDGSGWIGFKEAEANLGLDRRAFATFDVDNDGMILPGEFRRRYDAIVSTGGVFLPPRAKPGARPVLPATAAEVLEACDKDRDDGLSLSELDAALLGLRAERLDPEAILQQLDRNGSGELERPEIEELLALVHPAGASRGPRPKSVDDLFGELVAREIHKASTAQPPQIAGPVSSFRRLDLDRDGRITLEDLAELGRPLSLPVRPAAVLAALDRDGDGAVGLAEFRAAMGAAP